MFPYEMHGGMSQSALVRTKLQKSEQMGIKNLGPNRSQSDALGLLTRSRFIHFRHQVEAMHNSSKVAFSVLPDEIVLHIAHYVLSFASFELHETDFAWQCCQVARISARFRKAIHALITRVAVVDSRAFEPGLLKFAAATYDANTNRIVELCGRGVSELVIIAQNKGFADGLAYSIDAFAQCEMLKSLSVKWLRESSEGSDALGRPFKSLGPRIEALDISIGRHPECETISHQLLLMVAENCTSLNSFSYTGEFLSSLAPVWRAAGSILQKLVLHCDATSQWTTAIRDIGQHCLKLTDIAFFGAPGVDYVELLRSYGTQLKETVLQDAHTALPICSSLPVLCPNVRVEIRCTREGVLINKLGESVRAASFAVYNMVDAGVLAAEIANWPALERMTLSVRYIGFSVLRTFFPCHFEHLRILETCCPMMVLPSGALKCIASNTGRLEHFKLRIRDATSFDVLDDVVQANTRLQNIEVEIEKRRMNTEQLQVVKDLQRTVTSSTSLRLISVVLSGKAFPHNVGLQRDKKNIDKIFDLSMPLRRRGVSFNFFGTAWRS